MDDALLQLQLPRRPEAAAAARKALTALNGSLHLVSEERLMDAQLLITELVSNATCHASDAGDDISIFVSADESVMRVEVTDTGGGFDPTRTRGPSPDRGGGWGLRFVAALSHRWGVEGGADTTVWFEIDRPRRGEPLEVRPTPPQ